VQEPAPERELPATTPREVALGVENLTCQFGGVTAVDEVSLSCVPARITGLIGPNGAGKSTVVGAIAGSVRAASGCIRLNGRDITRLPEHVRARAGLARTFQIANVCAQMTVLENLLVGRVDTRSESLVSVFARWRWKASDRQGVQEARNLLDRFGLRELEEELAGNLSGGQRRLVEIMRALMGSPRILLLDEPMAGVNPALRDKLAGYLLELAEEGIAILMVEHELAMVDRMCDSVVVMAQGRVLASGSMADIRADRGVIDAYLVG
jgi:branched-chain amino acid transport system permease protein